MSKISSKDVVSIIKEAESKKELSHEFLIFTLGVEVFYSDKPRGPKAPKYSAPYRDIGEQSYNSILPLIRSVLCGGEKAKKNIRRSLALFELISVLENLFNQGVIVSILAIVLNKGVEEICAIDELPIVREKEKKQMTSWEKIKLKNLASIEYGKSQSEVYVQSSNYPIYGTGGVVGFAKTPLFKAPLILIGRKGTINRPILIMKDCWLIDTTFAIKPNEKGDIKFLYYLLIFHQLEKLNEATGVPSLSRENLYTLDLKLPPLNEQKKIAEILTSVDRVIELTSMEIDKLKDLKKGMMQELLTKGIGHTKFKDSPVGKIPESWDIKPLQEICSKITDGTHDTPKVISSGVPFITGKHIRDASIDFENCDYVSKEEHELIYKRCNPEYGDVIYVNIGAGTATPALIEIQTPFSMKNIALLKPAKNILDGRYLEISLLHNKTKIFSQNINGGAQPFLGLKTISELEICLPSYLEQLKISKIVTAIENLIRIKRINLQILNNSKKGLMNDLLSGKIRVKV